METIGSQLVVQHKTILNKYYSYSVIVSLDNLRPQNTIPIVILE